MTIGVICAIPQELAHLRAVLSGSEHHEIAHITFDVGELDGHRGALAQVCASFGIPWLVIRALSDLAGADSRLDFSRFVEEVAVSSALILLRLLPLLDAAADQQVPQ